jgi:hypothetical protein
MVAVVDRGRQSRPGVKANDSDPDLRELADVLCELHQVEKPVTFSDTKFAGYNVAQADECGDIDGAE